MTISNQDVPFESMIGASFATFLAEKFVRQGGNPVDLFVALAGVAGKTKN